jgi:hypothetical protein
MQEITMSPMLVSKEIVQKKWMPKFSIFKFFIGFLLYKNKIIKLIITEKREITLRMLYKKYHWLSSASMAAEVMSEKMK